VAPGIAADSTNADMLNLPVAISKTTGAWTVGNGGGGLDTGTIAASTWYHVYEIKRPDTQLVDVCVSANASTPVLGGGGYIPANYTTFRRLGSMKTNASSQWIAFVQIGDEFIWLAPVGDVTNATPGTASTAYLLASVPTGVSVLAKFEVAFANSVTVGDGLLIHSPLIPPQTYAAPPGNGTITSIATTGIYTYGQCAFWTNTLAQIMMAAQIASGNSVYIVTFGWVDRRGRDN
jgi:hypothetical protein